VTGPCAKVTVRCRIVTTEGHEYEATNAVRNPQRVCPREPGKNYEKCGVICRQHDGHAERQALAKAHVFAVGATAYVWAERERPIRICDDCRDLLTRAGVARIVEGRPE
jgi:hypothetical protein